MHIKNIRINGFRSYREQDFEKESLSPKHNVIVGRNGSGKSNFFAAIQFVLSERFLNLTAEERKSLFHEGAGRAYTTSVEITFDNSDGRLVLPGRAPEAEVSIRRTLGLKQDEFRVNERKFSGTEVRQLLESAGFSASNPYYVVEQGKIITLAHLKGEERYALLKEIAGTKVYESRRAESIALLESTVEKRERIDDNIGQLEKRLAQLESETAELKLFQEADYRRRAIECTIYDHQLEEAKTALDRLDGQWAARSGRSDGQNARRAALEAQIQARQADTVGVQHELAALEKERAAVERDLEELQSKAARVELQLNDQRESVTRVTAEKKALETEQRELEKTIDKAKSDLKTKAAARDDKAKAALAAAQKLQKDEVSLAALQARRGRTAHFKTRAKRDEWLKEEIARNEGLRKDKDTQIGKLEKAIQQYGKEIAAESAAIVNLRSKATTDNSSAKADAVSKDSLLAKRDKLGAERRGLWATLHGHEGELRRAHDLQEAAKRTYEKAVRHDIRQGLQSLQECLNEIGDEALRRSVHGQVITLIEANPEAITAIDVSAGNALFNVVVDSFDVSSRILSHMNAKKKPGRVTFFPLDTCNTKPMALPSTASMSPLLQHVKYDQKFAHVMAELFGRTMLLRQLEDGPKVVRDLDCNAVTYDGDQFSRKGGITGGFLDQRSKMRATIDVNNAQRAVLSARASVDAVTAKIATLEQQIAQVLAELDQIGTRAEAAKFADPAVELRVSEERLGRLRQSLDQATTALDAAKTSRPAIDSVIDSLKLEMAQEFKSGLSPEEEKQLESLQASVVQARAETSSKQAAALHAQADWQMVDDTANHLERRVHAVRDRLASLEAAAAASGADRDVKASKSDTDDAKARLKSVEEQTEKLAAAKRQHDAEVASLRQELGAIVVSAQDEKDAVDRAHNQRALLLAQKEDAASKIRKLGAVVPSDSAAMKAHSVGKLMAMLKSATDELKKYGHVNKKALDQYTMLRENFADLDGQRAQLKAESDSVQSLIQHLDKQKGEAIERTFKQVQFHFEEVFKELVAADGCFAKLELVAADDTGKGSSGAQDRYAAVRVQVSFGAGTPNAELSQLSGGQKSLVALALIFAIQRSDPAPFYLFDEIDAALDADYRTSVARLLRRQADHCQFITASFKTEMLDVADTIFGIFFQNKLSAIKAISREEGAALLHQAAMDERKRDRDAPLEMPARPVPAGAA